MTINAIRECSDVFDNNLPYSFHDYFDVPCLAPSRYYLISYVSCEVLVSKDLPVLTIRDKKFFVFKLFDIDGVTF